MSRVNAATRTTSGLIPTDVPVPATRTVTYLFNTGSWVSASVRTSSEKQLKLPYEVAFDRVVHRKERGWPQRIVGRSPFRVQVPVGTQVSLFLNSDALEGARRHPVYSVTPTEHDVTVTITETRGSAPGTSDAPVLSHSAVDPSTKRMTDYYTAPLHGNIWARISRVYTEAEAQALIPVDADGGVREAVASIYRVLTSSRLTASCSSPTGHRVVVSFSDSDNPRQNVSSYQLLRDGLTRVHPLGFYALIDAARLSGVTQLGVTSCWRPSLGSIAHRAGLGLDVNIVGDEQSSVRVNRAELIGRGPDVPWVTEEEKRLYRERQSSLGSWTSEVDRSKPQVFGGFQRALQASPYVKQLFDPWNMDANTQDAVGAAYNAQTSANEKLHNNHLHITLDIPGVI